ncbi:MAG: hypothetical protein AB8H86_20560 [Polyangiales bacterium]
MKRWEIPGWPGPATEKQLFESRDRGLWGCAAFFLVPIGGALAIMMAGGPMGEQLFGSFRSLPVPFRIAAVAAIGASPFLLLFAYVKLFVTPSYVRVLRNPSGIVWVYLETINSGAPSVVIGTNLGVLIKLPYPDAVTLSTSLQQWVPHATFGHTPQLKAQFLSNPQSLRNESS